MPHTIFKLEDGKLAGIAAELVGQAEAYVVSYAQEKVEEEIQKFIEQCPPPPVLNAMSRTINQVQRITGAITNKIKKVEGITKKLDPPIIGAKIIIDILTHVLQAKLTAIGYIPPTGGPVPGVIVPERVGRILDQSARLQFALDTVDKLEKEKDAIEDIVSDSGSVFDPMNSRLDQLRLLIERCMQDQDLTKDEREQILNGLRVASKDSSGDLSEAYRSENGKVYTIEIQDVLDNTIDVPRRRAVAKDFRGIVVMKGPASYSKNLKILKDEIKFRIDNQLP